MPLIVDEISVPLLTVDVVLMPLLTVDVVSLYQPATSLAHHHAVRVAVADVVVSKDRVSPSADVCTPPLVLSDHVF